MEDMTASKLFKTATDKGLTTLAFAEWMENKNKEFAQYQSEGGKKTFVEWENGNQNPCTICSIVKPLILVTVTVTVIILLVKNLE